MDAPDQIRNAVGLHPDGVTIRFDVVPGSSMVAVPSGFNPWRKSLEAKLTEKPTKGKANLQLTRELAALFEIPIENVQVMSGHKSSKKLVLVKYVNVEDAVQHLTKAQDDR
ncbi:MAG: DUF167 domain-containing protein [Methanotrichaceae archaeon]